MGDSQGPRQEMVGRGIALRIISAGFLSLMAALLKAASVRGVVALEMLFYRALFGLPVVLAWVLSSQGLSALATRRPWAHVGRSALGISSILCTFQALIMLPLADAGTLAFTAPIFATILSWLILREHVGRHRMIAVLCGFLGVLFVIRPGAGSDALPLAGVAIGLVAATGTASVTITLRHLGDTEHVAAIVFWFFVASLIVGGLLLPVFGSLHDPAVYFLLLGGGVAGGLMQITMTASLQFASVGVLSPFDYLQLVGALALGWLILSEVPTLYTIAGAVLIAGSGLYTAWRERRLRRSREARVTTAG